MNWVRKIRFSLWYYFNPPWDTGVSPPELLDMIQRLPPGRALDLGCGTGTNVITLAQHAWQVTGVDFAPPAIRAARLKARSLGVKATFLVADATRLEGVEGVFDLILDIGCFHSLSAEGRRAYLDQFDSLLSPGGIYMLYTFIIPPGEDRSGISEPQLEVLAQQFNQLSRTNGLDHGIRRSAWLVFQKKGLQKPI